MRRALCICTALCALAGAAAALPGRARADVFGPIELGSAGALVTPRGEGEQQQALYAHDPAISGNGRYVAFDGSFGGVTGVWRRDLASRVIEKVAGGDAELPSISENGQYVSFTTTARLDPLLDTNSDPDVYVRNMDVPESQPCEEEVQQPSQPCAFTLASAANGKSEGLSYEGTAGHGSVAAGRSALSADGSKVAFVTTAVSNLAGPGTPALQVAVRDLLSKETQLVSVREDPATGLPEINAETGEPEPVFSEEGGRTYGAVYAGAGAGAPAFGPIPGYGLALPVGASLSADGSTVAWMGDDIAEQAKVLPSEAHLAPGYTEPLWRRIADGTQAPTRRITGGSDPEDPACIAAGEPPIAQSPSAGEPCQGPFYVGLDEQDPGLWKGGGEIDFLPQLSADGSTVAFLSQAPLLARYEGFLAGLENSDLYVADMRGGLTRTQAVRPLTELASGNGADLATTGPIVDVGISPDGTQVAFTTERTEFPLGSPAYVSPPAAVPGMNELFDVDLADDTLTRVSHGFEGGPSEHPHEELGPGVDPYGSADGALSPSFSSDGQTLAFSSTASNLVYGDGNTPPASESGRYEKGEFDGSDAFVVPRISFTPTATETYVSSAPPAPALTPQWLMAVTALTLANGSVRLYVSMPGAGRLSAAGESTVRVTGHARAAARGRARGRPRTTVATRRVASTAKAVTSPAGGVVELTLTLARSYRALALEPGGLSAAVTVSFAAPAHKTLKELIDVTFRSKAKPAPAARRRGPRKGRRR
ncbi:MAG: hypothetical protein ABSG95_09810 [Solirubrobacteraceae bacterium]|jgi:hypothetical protein